MNTPHIAHFEWFEGVLHGYTIAKNSSGGVLPKMDAGADAEFPYSEIAAEINTASLVTIAARDSTIASLQSQLAALQAEYDAYAATHP